MSGTSAGGVDIAWRSDTSSFEAGAAKVETLSRRAAEAIQRATDRQVADNNRFIASIQRQVDTFGLSGTALLAYEAKLRGVTASADPLIAKLNDLKAAQASVNNQAAATGFKAITEGAATASHATAGMTRELIVLAHEASQGNLKRFGGSLLVLSEYSQSAQAAIRSLAGPVGIVAAGLGLFALAMYEGAKASDTLRKSLILTGNFAGQTAGSFEAMTHVVADATGATLGKAASALQALVSTGEIGPRELQKMAEATVKLEELSGKSADEIAKDFARMAEAPTKWAAEANKAYNFLTLPQYEYIKRLEEQGHKEEAEMEVVNRLNEHFGKKIPEALTGLGSALREGALLWDKFWHSLLHEGAPETIEDKLASVEKNLRNNFDSSGKRVSQNFDTSSIFDGGSKRALEIQRETLLHDQLRQAENALSVATQARYAKAGIAASDYFSKLQEERKGTDRLKKDLDELQANIRKRVEAGGPASLPEDAENEAFIRHRDRSFQDKAGEKLDTRYKDRLESLRAEGVRLDQEAANWEKYGKAINDSHLALVNLEIAQGKLQGLSPAKIANLQKQAGADDDKARALSLTQANAAEEKSLSLLEKETQAHAMNSSEKERARLIAELEAKGIQESDPTYARYVERIDAIVKAQAELNTAKSIEEQIRKTDDTVRKLEEETNAIGKGTLARLQLAAAIKIEQDASDRKQKAAGDPAAAAQIDAQAAIDKARESSAIAANYNANRTFEAGSAIAFQKYQEDAGNAAAFAERVVSGGLKNMEDALISFANTGKLSFSSLFKFMADEFLRNQIRMMVSGGANGGGLGSMLGSIGSGFFSGNASTAAATASALPGDSLDNLMALTSAFATIPAFDVGTNYVPYDGMIATLHKGEAVVPAAYNPAAGGKGAGAVDASFKGNVSVAAGLSRGDVNAAIGQALAVHEKHIRRLNRQGVLN